MVIWLSRATIVVRLPVSLGAVIAWLGLGWRDLLDEKGIATSLGLEINI